VCICVEGRSAVQYITIVPRISPHVNYRLFINVSAIKFQVRFILFSLWGLPQWWLMRGPQKTKPGPLGLTAEHPQGYKGFPLHIESFNPLATSNPSDNTNNGAVASR